MIINNYQVKNSFYPVGCGNGNSKSRQLCEKCLVLYKVKFFETHISSIVRGDGVSLIPITGFIFMTRYLLIFVLSNQIVNSFAFSSLIAPGQMII